MGFKTQDGFQFTGSGDGLKYVSGKRISFYISEQGNPGADPSSGAYNGTSGIVSTNIVLDLNATISNSYGGSGTTWTDISGQGNNGTLTNGPTYSSDNGGAIVFDGSNDVVTIPDDSSLQISANITIAGWINPSGFGGGNYARLISKVSSYKFFLDNTTSTGTNGIRYWPSTGNALTVDNKVTLNEWAYFAVVQTGTNVVIYKNGVSIGTASNFTSLASNSSTTYIGNNNDGSRGFDGKIAQIHMYDAALTASEVLQNYNATKSNYITALITANLVLHLDASNTSSYSGSGTTWSDISGNNNDLTLTNGPTFNSQDGGVIVFDGTNDYAISALNQAFFQFGTGDYSYGLWVKLDTQGSSSYAAVLSSGPTENGSWQIDLYLTNKFRHNLKDSGGGANQLATNTISNFTNTWHYLFVVNDRSEDELKIYVNGVLNATGSSTNYGSTNVGNFSSATDVKNVFNVATNRNQDSFIDGSVGQVHVYKGKALTASEVLQNYNATKGNFLGAISTTNLVFYVDASKSMSYSGSGTTWSDLSSSSNDGTLTNGPTFDSTHGGSIVFDGTDDYVVTSSDMFNANADFTLSVWFLSDTFATGVSYAVVADVANSQSLYLRYNDGSFKLVNSNTAILGTFSSSSLSTNTWYNITLTRSSNNYTLYVNGSSVSTVNSSQGFNHSPTTIGANNNNAAPPAYKNNFDGKIAQVFAYSSALSASDVLSNYNATKFNYHELITTNLVLHLDASNSSSYSGSGTTWTDLSSSSNDGTLENGVSYSSNNGGYLIFDGSDDFISFTDSSDFAVGTGDFTSESWIQLNNSSGFVRLLTFVNPSNTSNTYTFTLKNNEIYLWSDGINDYALRVQSLTNNVGTWYHIVFSRISGTLKLYINAVEAGSTSFTENITWQGLLIGKNKSGTSFSNANHAQSRLYKGKGLTASEVLQNYNATKTTYGY